MTAAGRAGTLLTVVLALAGIALNILTQRAVATAEPFTDFGVLVRDALVGSSYAISAVVSAALGSRRAAGWMLVGAFCWTFATLVPFAHLVTGWWIVLYSVSGAMLVVIVALIVSFPTGRIDDLVGRLTLGVALTLFAVRAIVRLVGELGDWCLCVPNPVLLIYGGLPDEWYTADLVIGIVMPALAVLGLVVRWIRGSRPWRSAHLAMTLVSVAFAVFSAWNAGDSLTSQVDQGPGVGYVHATLFAAVPVVFVAGLAGMRNARGRVADVVVAARVGIARAMWDRLVADSLDDRAARVLWTDGDRFVDRDGQTATPSASHTPVGDPPLAVIEHDSAISSRRELLSSLAASIAMVAENEKLTRELGKSLAKLRESRARLVDAGDDARRRIERDLHDGAQQLLLTAALNVERAVRLAAATPDRNLHDSLDLANRQLASARRELRELARGITPAVLHHGGLAGALEELALRSAVPTTVVVTGSTVPDEVVATTVYFSVAEALTNAARHAEAAAAEIRADLGDIVAVTVSDNGKGGAHLTAGGGLAGLADRIEAVGGELRVGAAASGGTVVDLRIPARSKVGA